MIGSQDPDPYLVIIAVSLQINTQNDCSSIYCLSTRVNFAYMMFFVVQTTLAANSDEELSESAQYVFISKGLDTLSSREGIINRHFYLYFYLAKILRSIHWNRHMWSWSLNAAWPDFK